MHIFSHKVFPGIFQVIISNGTVPPLLLKNTPHPWKGVFRGGGVGVPNKPLVIW